MIWIDWCHLSSVYTTLCKLKKCKGGIRELMIGSRIFGNAFLVKHQKRLPCYIATSSSSLQFRTKKKNMYSFINVFILFLYSSAILYSYYTLTRKGNYLCQKLLKKWDYFVEALIYRSALFNTCHVNGKEDYRDI